MVTRHRALKPARAPACSVCVANYNGRGTLDACLASIRQQVGAGEIEIIVHDDASPDGSAAGLQQRRPEVELLLASENVGYCISNNRMAEIARGEFILLLNNDAVLHADAIASLLRRARERGPAILGLPQYDAGTGALLDRGSLLDPFLNPLPNLDPARRDVGLIMGACLWIPRALWRELGGFPVWFHTLAEDLYLCCAARVRGVPVEVLPSSGFNHWVGRSLGGGKVVAGGLRTSFRRRAYSERNKTFVMVACYPAAALLPLLPLHLLLLAAEGLALALVRREPAIWREIYGFCLRELWHHRHRLRALRAAAQSGRRASLRQFFAPHTRWPHKLTLLLRHGLPRIEGPPAAR